MQQAVRTEARRQCGFFGLMRIVSYVALQASVISVLSSLLGGGASAAAQALMPDSESVQEIQASAETPTIAPHVGALYSRDSTTYVRSAPGFEHPARYRINGVGNSFPSLGKHSDWYKLDLGGGRTGFVHARDVHSERSYNIKISWIEFVDDLDSFIHKAKKENAGQFAKYSGLYLATKSCAAEANHLVPKSGTIFGQEMSYIWFKNEIMYSVALNGTLKPKEARLIPSRVQKAKPGSSVQWYRWGESEVAFFDGKYAFEPKFKDNQASFSWAVKCNNEEQLIERLLEAFDDDIKRIRD